MTRLFRWFLFLGFMGCFIGNFTSSVYSWPVVDGVPISTATSNQSNPVIASDGSGGAIIAWHDGPSGNTDIYCQRINSIGSTLWTLNGVAICTAANAQVLPKIAPDGFGGVIISWRDSRNGNYDIFAQRVNSSGVPQWTLNGIAISTAANSQHEQKITSDALGGAIFCWQDDRSGGTDIYVQRVDSSGTPLWTSNGLAICTAVNNQLFPEIANDGLGGAIITWGDGRNGANSDVYAQRVQVDGTMAWTDNGLAISTAADYQAIPAITNDGSNGAIIVWRDHRNGNDDIYGQRVNSTGSTLWTLNGAAICTALSNQYYNTIVNDGSGGAIIPWYDDRNAGITDIYVQRVNNTGSTLWTLDGVAICTVAYYQYISGVVTDGTGGAIMSWFDGRDGSFTDIYSQRVNSTGSTLWTLDGVAICTAANYQSNPAITTDGLSGAIMAWIDYRNGTNYDLYAQSISNGGVVPVDDWFNYSNLMDMYKLD